MFANFSQNMQSALYDLKKVIQGVLSITFIFLFWLRSDPYGR